MNSLGCLFVLVAIATAHAGHIGVGLVGPGTHGAVLHGPGSHASVVGPDGSHIAGSAAGGAVVAPALPGGHISAAVSPGHIGVGVGHLGVGVGHLGVGVVPAVAYGAGIGYGGVIAGGHGDYEGYPALGVGSGHEGQWVPDYTEHLYDDGSYRGEHHYAGHHGGHW